MNGCGVRGVRGNRRQQAGQTCVSAAQSNMPWPLEGVGKGRVPAIADSAKTCSMGDARQ